MENKESNEKLDFLTDVNLKPLNLRGGVSSDIDLSGVNLEEWNAPDLETMKKEMENKESNETNETGFLSNNKSLTNIKLPLLTPIDLSGLSKEQLLELDDMIRQTIENRKKMYAEKMEIEQENSKRK